MVFSMLGICMSSKFIGSYLRSNSTHTHRIKILLNARDFQYLSVAFNYFLIDIHVIILVFPLRIYNDA